MKIPVASKNFEKYINAATILKSIAHPHRLVIIRFLENNDYKAVFEIQKATEIEPTLLSHHLNRMKDRGILTLIKQGRFRYYKLSHSGITKVLDCIDKCYA